MREYIRDLRKLVGPRPILMCGSSVIIKNTENQVLMLLRSDNNCWCFPGGAAELGEKIEETAAREVYEETGLILESLELFGVFSGQELYYQYPNGDEVFNVDIVYTSSTYTGDLNMSVEGKDIRFFDIINLPGNINPPTRPIVEELIKRSHEISKKI